MSTIYQPKGRAGEYSKWALNLYGGCGHGCRYCYAPTVRNLKPEEFHSNIYPYPNILRRLEIDCNRYRAKISTPIMLCFTSDPYQPADVEFRITRQAIELLKRYGFRVCILTKGGLRATRDLDLLQAGKDVMACTLTFTDPVRSSKWEPHAAPPEERFELLRKAKEEGLSTWASLEPVIDPRQSLEIIRRTHEYVDLYKVGTWNYDARSGKIDWHTFAAAVIDTLAGLGCNWYIKNDLARYLPTGVPQRSGEQV